MRKTTDAVFLCILLFEICFLNLIEGDQDTVCAWDFDLTNLLHPDALLLLQFDGSGSCHVTLVFRRNLAFGRLCSQRTKNSRHSSGKNFSLLLSTSLHTKMHFMK